MPDVVAVSIFFITASLRRTEFTTLKSAFGAIRALLRVTWLQTLEQTNAVKVPIFETSRITVTITGKRLIKSFLRAVQRKTNVF